MWLRLLACVFTALLIGEISRGAAQIGPSFDVEPYTGLSLTTRFTSPSLLELIRARDWQITATLHNGSDKTLHLCGPLSEGLTLTILLPDGSCVAVERSRGECAADSPTEGLIAVPPGQDTTALVTFPRAGTRLAASGSYKLWLHYAASSPSSDIADTVLDSDNCLKALDSNVSDLTVDAN